MNNCIPQLVTLVSAALALCAHFIACKTLPLFNRKWPRLYGMWLLSGIITLILSGVFTGKVISLANIPHESLIKSIFVICAGVAIEEIFRFYLIKHYSSPAWLSIGLSISILETFLSILTLSVWLAHTRQTIPNADCFGLLSTLLLNAKIWLSRGLTTIMHVAASYLQSKQKVSYIAAACAVHAAFNVIGILVIRSL